MLDLRRTAAPLRAAVGALAAALAVLLLLAAAPGARAAGSGELAAFGGTDFNYAGPVAVDAADGNAVYAGDFDVSGAPAPRIRKYAADGQLKATLTLSGDDGSGGLVWIAGLAVDGSAHRLYVLTGATDANGQPATFALRAYSTTPQGGTLAAASGVPASGVLANFRGSASGATTANPTGIAVDPTDGRVAIVGTDDLAAATPKTVIQYVTSAGAVSTRRTGVGGDVDSLVPAGLAAGPDGSLFFVTGIVGEPADIWRVPPGSGAPVKVATDPSANNPGLFPSGAQNGPMSTPLVAVSSDGGTVYLAESNDPSKVTVRGFSVADGSPTVVFGGGTSSCHLGSDGTGIRVAAGSGGVLAVLQGGSPQNGDQPIHVFGPGGTGCPRPTGAFTVAGKGDATVTVTKGQSVTFDASGTQTLGGDVSATEWDFDGSGQFATKVTGATPLKTTRTFTSTGTFHVGVRVQVAGFGPSDPVYRDVKVVAPTPIAAFTASTRTPAAGAVVTFDASGSTDPGAASVHELATYRWDFGDGATQETTSPTVTHAFANAGTSAVQRSVKLVVVSKDGVSSQPVQLPLTVAGQPAAQLQPGPQPQPQPQPLPQPQPRVTPPAATVGGGSVDAKGMLSLKVSCPAGGLRCAGDLTLTVKSTTKVKGKKKTKTFKLGKTSFSVDPGKSQTLTVKLSSGARSALAKQRKLSVTAVTTITAGGQTKTTSKTLTVKASKSKKAKR